MNERELLIVKSILTFLDRVDSPMLEIVIHAAAQTALRNAAELPPSLSEFNAAIRLCDHRGWIVGLPSKITRRMKWSLTDAGKAALIEI